jgi:hypothetical protein
MYIERAYIAAWLLPALVGSGIWFALRDRPRGLGDIPAAIGAGWLIGLVVATLCARFAAVADTAHTFARTWPWCAAIGLVAWIVAIARMRRMPVGLPRSESASSNGMRWVWWLLLIWIVARILLIGDEASLRPVFPWDAWSAWATKPKAWFFAGRVEPYVPMLDWLARPKEALRTAAAWSYPEFLAWVQLWFASAAGVWNEPLVDVAWCGALAAFALAAYGYWRASGLAPWIAMALVYGLVSLPLIDAHVALAGYADLWVALVLGLATLAWSRWLIARDRGQWLLAVASALCLPAIKLEGMVWLLVFSAIVALDLVPRRWRWHAVLGLSVAAMLGVFVANEAGSIHLSWNQIEIPSLGTFALAWHGVGGAMIESLFTLPNWHLLWYVLPVLLVLRRRRFREDRAACMLGLMLLIDFTSLFVLFFFTTASAWAQDFTSANRLILQLVPSVFVLAAVLLRARGAEGFESSRADRRTTQASVVPSVPV